MQHQEATTKSGKAIASGIVNTTEKRKNAAAIEIVANGTVMAIVITTVAHAIETVEITKAEMQAEVEGIESAANTNLDVAQSVDLIAPPTRRIDTGMGTTETEAIVIGTVRVNGRAAMVVGTAGQKPGKLGKAVRSGSARTGTAAAIGIRGGVAEAAALERSNGIPAGDKMLQLCLYFAFLSHRN